MKSKQKRTKETKGYVPRYWAGMAYGNWWVKDLDDVRIICMATRQSDAEEIARLLNKKDTKG